MKKSGNFKTSFFKKSLIIYGVLVVGVAFSISYTLSVLAFRFFYLSDREKLFLLSPLFLSSIIILLFLPRKNISQITKIFIESSRVKKILFLSFLFGITIFTSIFQSHYIPSSNTFQLSIVQSNNESNEKLEIVEISTIDRNGRQIKVVSPFELTLIGDWNINKTSIEAIFNSNNGLIYHDLSAHGIRMVLQKKPGLGQISINWNGKKQIIDLNNSSYDQVEVDFLPYFSWENQSPIRKILFCLIPICIFITYLSLFFLIGIVIHLFRQSSFKFSRLSLFQKLFFITLLISPFINLFAFLRFQSTDIYKLKLVKDNTFIGLDNSSTDNFPNFQVYLKISEYYNGRDLILPRGSLSTLRLSELQLIKLGRLKSISEENYDQEISNSQMEYLLGMSNYKIPPVGRIPYNYIFFKDTSISQEAICIWQYMDDVFFIPDQKDFPCKKGN